MHFFLPFSSAFPASSVTLNIVATMMGGQGTFISMAPSYKRKNALTCLKCDHTVQWHCIQIITWLHSWCSCQKTILNKMLEFQTVLSKTIIEHTVLHCSDERMYAMLCSCSCPVYCYLLKKAGTLPCYSVSQ